jgi:hypothetical protein
MIRPVKYVQTALSAGIQPRIHSSKGSPAMLRPIAQVASPMNSLGV